MFLRSGADGLYSAGRFRSAIDWYREAQEINHDSLTQVVIEAAEKAKRAGVTQTVSLMGGPIIYSHGRINDQGNRYRYDRGSFLSAGTRLASKKGITAEFEYNRFNASFRENTYGINRLYTSLDNSQGFPWTNTEYNLHDSLNNWSSEDPENNWYRVGNVTAATYLGREIKDTTWLLYKDISTQEAGRSSFDTTISFTPDAIFQNGFYAALSVQTGKKLPWNIAGSFNLSQSNMENMNQGASFRVYQGVILRYLSLGGHWYVTFTEKVGTIQASPEVSGSVKKFTWRVTPSYVLKTDAPAIMNIPANQFSVETEMGVAGKDMVISATGAVGKRAFTAESSGKNVVTISLPHRFTGSIYGAVMPGSGRFTIYSLLRYENFEQLSRLIALGGLSVTF